MLFRKLSQVLLMNFDSLKNSSAFFERMKGSDCSGSQQVKPMKIEDTHLGNGSGIAVVKKNCEKKRKSMPVNMKPVSSNNSSKFL